MTKWKSITHLKGERKGQAQSTDGQRRSREDEDIFIQGDRPDGLLQNQHKEEQRRHAEEREKQNVISAGWKKRKSEAAKGKGSAKKEQGAQGIEQKLLELVMEAAEEFGFEDAVDNNHHLASKALAKMDKVSIKEEDRRSTEKEVINEQRLNAKKQDSRVDLKDQKSKVDLKEQDSNKQASKQQEPQQQEEQQESKQEAPDNPIPDNLDKVIKRLTEEIGYKTSFDVVLREMTLGNTRTAFLMMNGLAKDTVLTEVLKRLTYLDGDEMTSDILYSFMSLYVPAVQVSKEIDWNKMLTMALSGVTIMFIDGEKSVLMIDAKNFPARSPDEPALERVVRGARDGFVETLMFNVSLVRRRLRDPRLRYEILRVGERTQTDVSIGYIDDIADMELVESIRDKIKAVKIDGIPLADKQLEEATVKRGWNPFPLVRYSERPDVVAAQLLEGNVAVFVDTTPSVMILPTTFFDLVQHAEENRQTPFIGTYLRWVRFIGILASMFLMPMWFLFVLKPELLPPDLSFIGPTKEGKLPLLVQFLLAEFGVDLMRMASVHTPTPLATAMSLVSAILVGDIAVKSGLFINEVILYMAVSAIGMFATPSYELGLANRIVRLCLIVTVAIFKVPGLIVGSTAIFLMLCVQRSFNRPYMWPFIPFDLRALLNIVFRVPVMSSKKRPNLLRPQQRDKMPTGNQ